MRKPSQWEGFNNHRWSEIREERIGKGEANEIWDVIAWEAINLPQLCLQRITIQCLSGLSSSVTFSQITKHFFTATTSDMSSLWRRCVGSWILFSNQKKRIVVLENTHIRAETSMNLQCTSAQRTNSPRIQRSASSPEQSKHCLL